jgi:hypothetical protein
LQICLSAVVSRSEKYRLWVSDKENNKRLITASSKWYTVTAAAYGKETTVATQEELDKALADDEITKITIATDKEINFIIAKGNYLNKILVVNAPNADVENHANFKNIEISAIKENTWSENADGNSFRVTSIKVRIIVNGNAEVREIVLDRENSVISLEVEGTVHQITVLQPSHLNMSGDSEQIPITIEDTGEGSKITTSIPIKIDAVDFVDDLAHQRAVLHVVVGIFESGADKARDFVGAAGQAF